MKAFVFVVFSQLIPVSALTAQETRRDLIGSWQVDAPEGAQTIVVSDSTVTFGEEEVNWRITADTIYVQFGDEWVGYNYELNGNTLTLSGGDLIDPVILRRVVPPAFRE